MKSRKTKAVEHLSGIAASPSRVLNDFMDRKYERKCIIVSGQEDSAAVETRVNELLSTGWEYRQNIMAFQGMLLLFEREVI